MAAPWPARLLESLGIRAFYGFAAARFSESVLPPVDRLLVQAPPIPDAETLAERREGARYYGWANAIRGAIYLYPLGLALQQDVTWIAGYCGALMAWHTLCVLLEVYKGALFQVMAQRLAGGAVPDGVPEGEPPQPRGLSKAYFRPWAFETARFYRLAGIARVQQIVLAYIERTQLTPAERKAGKRVRFLKSNSKADVRRFEHGTRIGEAMHLLGLAINVPLALGATLLGWIGVASVAWGLVVADGYLVLLQRYHRLRVWPTIERSGVDR